MFLTLAVAVYAVKPDARAVLPQVADALPCFAATAFAYNRHRLHELPTAMRETYERQIDRATDPRFDPAVLLALLADPRPKVRTLAAAALYSRDEPAHLPRLLALADDPAESFPAANDRRAIWQPDAPPDLCPQTVGDCVRRMVYLYLPDELRRHDHDGPKPPFPADKFLAYWAPRKDRPHCAGWFRVALARASGGIEPTQPDRVAAIRAVRARIDRLPEPDRTLTLLTLANASGGDVLTSDADLLAGCKAVGRDWLLILLRREPLTDDPDLQPHPKGDSEYGRSPRRFVLQHAAELLKPQDADAVNDLGRREAASGLSNPYRSPDWAIAAADLRPDRAKEFLTAAWDQFQSKYDGDARAFLVVARRRHDIDDGPRFTVNWFYTDPPARSSYGFGTDRFLTGLRNVPADRKLVVELVRDERFGRIEGQTLQNLIAAVNGWEPRPVVSYDAMQSVTYLSSTRDYNATIPEKFQAQLDTALANWRAAMRAWADKQ